jgi:hypothetical protein
MGDTIRIAMAPWGQATPAKVAAIALASNRQKVRKNRGF